MLNLHWIVIHICIGTVLHCMRSSVGDMTYNLYHSIFNLFVFFHGDGIISWYFTTKRLWFYLFLLFKQCKATHEEIKRIKNGCAAPNKNEVQAYMCFGRSNLNCRVISKLNVRCVPTRVLDLDPTAGQTVNSSFSLGQHRCDAVSLPGTSS